MLWYEQIVNILNLIFCDTVIAICYKYLTKSKEKIFVLKNILVILLITLVMYLNFLYNYTSSKILVSYISFVVMNKLIFKGSILETCFNTIIVYGTELIIEIVCTLILLASPYKNVLEIDKNVFMKLLFSLLIILITLLVFIKLRINKTIKKIYKFMIRNDKIPLIFVISVVLLLLSMITFRSALDYSPTNYIINLILVITFLLTCGILFFKIYQVKKAEEKEETLLEFMKTYENTIDNDRMLKHEICNNLLSLKSIKNKTSEEFEEEIDKLISEYENNEKDVRRNLYNLPTGLKGILYYKLKAMEDLKLNTLINISADSVVSLDYIKPKVFIKVCKILGILMDNAKEAANESEEKNVILDIYKEENKVVFIIENSMKEKVDLNLINNKHYSTKGKNRGYGLYVVKKLTEENKNFEFEQQIIGGSFSTTFSVYI